MKALLYRGSVPRYLLARALGKRLPPWALDLKLVEVPPPEPPAGWVKVRVVLAGICGSDIALLYGKSSPRLAPFFSFPAVLGHEVVVETDQGLAVVNPLLTCRERGLPLCRACQSGDEALCERVTEGKLAPGMIGYCRDLPGGWSEEVAVHPEQLYPVPNSVPPKRAVLAEPLAVVLRGLRLLEPPEEPGLIIGAGTVGLLSLAALWLLGHKGKIHIVARYPRQAELAHELGASGVYRTSWQAVKALGGRSHRTPIGPPTWQGPFPWVIDAAGSQASLDQALWAVRNGGPILLIGAPGTMELDLSPLWFRGLKLIGTYTYSRRDFGQAVELLPRAVGLEKLVTHVFPLSRYRQALSTIRSRAGIKVALQPD